jgi:hypothetical protein
MRRWILVLVQRGRGCLSVLAGHPWMFGVAARIPWTVRGRQHRIYFCKISVANELPRFEYVDRNRAYLSPARIRRLS